MQIEPKCKVGDKVIVLHKSKVVNGIINTINMYV